MGCKDAQLCGSGAAEKASMKTGDVAWTTVKSGKDTEKGKSTPHFCFALGNIPFPQMLFPLCLMLKGAQKALYLMVVFPFLSLYTHALIYIYLMLQKGNSAGIHWVIVDFLGGTFFTAFIYLIISH